MRLTIDQYKNKTVYFGISPVVVFEFPILTKISFQQSLFNDGWKTGHLCYLKQP